MTQIIAVYSEAGGATKTTGAVSLAMEAAKAGFDTLLVDLDPRGAATKWIGVEPSAPGLHVGAILASEDPTGWAESMAVPTPWHPKLRMLPSHREVSLREKESADQSEIRLKASLVGVRSKIVVIDCPNRQGGPLTLNALTAADDLVIAAKADEDGLDGAEGAMMTLNRFRKNCIMRGIPEEGLVKLRGIMVGLWVAPITPRNATYILEALQKTWPGQVLLPLIPQRVIVAESRTGGTYYGNYPKGVIVADTYRELAAQIISGFPAKPQPQGADK